MQELINEIKRVAFAIQNDIRPNDNGNEDSDDSNVDNYEDHDIMDSGFCTSEDNTVGLGRRDDMKSSCKKKAQALNDDAEDMDRRNEYGFLGGGLPK